MIKTPNGITLAHDDHGLSSAHLDFIDQVSHNFDCRESISKTVHYMPSELERLSCELHGPVCGDYPVSESEVIYRRRNGRPGLSRLTYREPRPADYMTIISTRDKNKELIILTAYGCMNGKVERLAPRECWDVGMKPYETLKSAEFWMSHALSVPDGLSDELDYLEKRFEKNRHIVEIADEHALTKLVNALDNRRS